MEAILDFSKPFDVDLLDKVVNCMYSSSNQNEIQAAQKVLTQFQNHPQSFTVVDKILEKSNLMNTKYIALQILQKVIQYKWKILPEQQRTGIKNYLLNTIIKRSSNAEILQKEKVLIQKLDDVLVQIIKQEWPQKWRNFIPEIVGASKTNESLCENNMIILKLLSEEIFDFSNGKMTTSKIKELKESFNKEFSMIYQLCEFILNKAQKPSLITATLQTLLRFLNWIPLGYIFETKMIEHLVTKFFPVVQFRNDALRCLTEIAGIIAPTYNAQLEAMYLHVMKLLIKMVPPQTDIPKVYKTASSYDQQFVQILGLFFCAFFKNHGKLLEKPQTVEALLQGHHYLVEISKVDDTEIFKACLEYWNFLAQDLYFSSPSSMGKKQWNTSLMLDRTTDRKNIYAQILSKVRHVMVSKMARPEEVIIVEDENGDLIKEYMKDVDSIQLYKSMRETLILLTNLDFEDTENIMLAKLQAQVNGSEWSWHKLNTLCWAIGSISGAMEEKDEKRFLVTVIKDLLGMCDMMRGKENKAVIASNIMYVVGQYPRFLIAHWKFLKTVVYKLFEFMHETFPGVQDMAVDTFLKVAKQCRHKFVQQHSEDPRPFIEELLSDLPEIIKDLEPAQIQTFYEAVGYMISSAPPHKREVLIMKLMEMLNSRWSAIMRQAAQRIQTLTDQDTIKDLINLLKTNVSVAKSLKGSYIYQLRHIFRDMLEVYRAYSQMISQEVSKNVQSTQHAHVRAMRSVKKETLRLVEIFIQNAEDTQIVMKHFVPPLLEATLGDYKSSVPDAKDAGVLAVLTSMMKKLKGEMIREMPRILEYVLECTLPMITKNFQDYPEHRTNFFNLLRAINKHCFQSFFAIPPQGFKLIIDSILWAVKHTERNISETGLYMLIDLMGNVEQYAIQNPQMVNSFYASFFVPIIQDVLFVLTDTFHKSGFPLQVQILNHMFGLIAQNKITAPIYDTKKYQQKSNQEFLRDYIMQLISKNFPNMNKTQITNFVHGFFSLSNDHAAFKKHLHDFLVEMKIFSPQDIQEEQNKAIQAAKLEQMKQVPGLIKKEEQ